MKTIIAAIALLTSGLCLGDVFYWRGDRATWQDWSNIAVGGWSLEKDSYSVPSHVPGTMSSDLIWPFSPTTSGWSDYEYTVGKFDLGGRSYTLAGYSLGSGAGQTWKSYQLHFTNGTITVSDAKKVHAGTTYQYYVWNGAVLNYNMPGIETSSQRSSSANIYNIGNGSLYAKWFVKNGGLLNVASPVTFFRHQGTVDAGGTLKFSNGTFDINNNIASGYPITITSSGTISILSRCSFDNWSSTSKVRIESISSPKKSIR